MYERFNHFLFLNFSLNIVYRILLYEYVLVFLFVLSLSSLVAIVLFTFVCFSVKLDAGVSVTDGLGLVTALRSKLLSPSYLRHQKFKALAEITETPSVYPAIPCVYRGGGMSQFTDPHELLPRLARFSENAFDSRTQRKLSSFIDVTDRVSHVAFPASFAMPGSRFSTESVGVHLPDGCDNEELDIIPAIGHWFTRGHIEEAGSCSTATLVSGNAKLWLLGLTLRASRFIEYRCDTVFHFIDFIRTQPRFHASIAFLIQKPGDVIFVPPLCAHTVLTFPPQFNDSYATFLAGYTCFSSSMRGDDEGMSFIWQ